MDGQLLLLSEFLGVAAVIMLLSLSPIVKNRRLLTFLYPKREGSAAITVTILIVLVTAFFLRLGGGLSTGLVNFASYPGLLGAPGYPQVNSVSLVNQLLFSFLLILPVGISLVVRKQPLLSIGLMRNTKIGLQMGGALAILVIFLHGKVFAIINGLKTGAIPGILIALVAAISEEVVFRGYLQPRLSAWLGEKWGWLAGVIFYMIWWGMAALAGSPLSGFALAGAVIYRLVFGLLLGWLMKKTGSLIGPILYHASHLWVAFL